MSNNINTRIKNKIDTEENWKKATDFIPLDGEQIIYKKDENYDYERIKIGDGITSINDLKFVFAQPDYDQQNPLSQNFIKNKTHYKEIVSESINWDGIGKYDSITNNEGFTYYKVQEAMDIDYDLLYNNGYLMISMTVDNQKVSINHNNKEKYGIYIESDGTNLVVYADIDNYFLPQIFNIVSVPCNFFIGEQDYTFEREPGLYFVKIPGETEDAYVEKLSFNLYHKLDNAYLDVNILTRENKLSELYGDMSEVEKKKVRDKIGAGTSNFNGDFNNLINLPFYASPFNFSWDGDTTGLDEVISSDITVGDQIVQFSFYKISDTPIAANQAIGANISIMIDSSEDSYTISESDILYGQGSNKDSFLIALEPMGYLPCVCSIQNSYMRFTTSIEGVGEISAYFQKPGLYLVSSMGIYVSSFLKEDKTLDEKFIPNTIARAAGTNSVCQIGVVDGLSETELAIMNWGKLYEDYDEINPGNLSAGVYDLTGKNAILVPFFSIGYSNYNLYNNSPITVKLATKIDPTSLEISEFISIETTINTHIINNGEFYHLYAYKNKAGNWYGYISGGINWDRIHQSMQSSPSSYNTLSEQGIYNFVKDEIAKSIGDALGGSY